MQLWGGRWRGFIPELKPVKLAVKPADVTVGLSQLQCWQGI